MKLCTLGKTHKWIWRKNVITEYINGSTVQFSSKGVYRCACGERKYGETKIPPLTPGGYSASIPTENKSV